MVNKLLLVISIQTSMLNVPLLEITSSAYSKVNAACLVCFRCCPNSINEVLLILFAMAIYLAIHTFLRVVVSITMTLTKTNGQQQMVVNKSLYLFINQ